jgi:hypothetical protein
LPRPDEPMVKDMPIRSNEGYCGDSLSSLGAAGSACRLTGVTAGTKSDWTTFGPTCAGFARLVAYIYKSSRLTTESRIRLGGTYGGNLVTEFLSMPAQRFAQDAYHSVAAAGRKSGSRRGGPVWTTKMTNPRKVMNALSLCHQSRQIDTQKACARFASYIYIYIYIIYIIYIYILYAGSSQDGSVTESEESEAEEVSMVTRPKALAPTRKGTTHVISLKFVRVRGVPSAGQSGVADSPTSTNTQVI